jgi:ribosomal protein L35
MGKRVTTKALTKRVRITKSGKLVRRSMGVNHFKTRKSNNNNRAKRKARTFSAADHKNIVNY